MSQPVQKDGNGSVRLFENSDIEIIEIVRNYFSINTALSKICPRQQT